jgi:hypothetical protein
VTKFRYHAKDRPEVLVMTPDPIDIIILGHNTVRADRLGATSVWLSEPCQFVDCDETVFYSPNQWDAAVDVYFMREVDDDCLLVCCRDHKPNNWPAILGVDIYAARNALAANGGCR